MTLRQHTSIDTHSNDATWRAVCQTLHDSFVAAGLVQTADTGQIDLATALRPTVSSTAAGYEIWRFNDALAATAPLYFKFEYGIAGSSTIFGFWVTTGSGSDGGGTITVQTGTVTTRRTLQSNASVGGTGMSHRCYFDYLSDGSGFAFAYWPSAAMYSGGALNPALAIERFRSYDGTPNADGWNVLYAYSSISLGAAASEARLYNDLIIQPTTALTFWPSLALPSALGSGTGSTVLNGTLYPIPVFTGSLPRAGAPSQLVLSVGKYDLAAGATVQVSHYGEIHTWVAAGTGGGGGWGYTDPLNKLTSFLIRAD